MKLRSYVKPNKEKMLGLVSKRYKRMKGKIPFTIKMLNKSESFKKSFLKLKRKGYPDWAIYMAVLNLNINLKLLELQKQGVRDIPSLNKARSEIFNEKEKEEDKVFPDNEYSEKKIEFAIDLTTMSFLKAEGFEMRRETPNIKALRQFAEDELDFLKYDLPHKKWFSFEKNYEK